MRSNRVRQVRCTIKADSLHAEVTTLPAGRAVVVDGFLFQEVDPEGCTWHVEDDKASSAGMRKLVISLEKRKQMRWLVLTRADTPV